MIQIIQADGRAEQARIAAMRARAAEVGADIEEAVSAVMGAVKEKGLSAVEAYSLKFDGKIPYENPREELEAAYDRCPDELIAAMERAAAQRAARAGQRRADVARHMEETKGAYPQFDLAAEMRNPRFAAIARAGVDIKTAYEIAHKDELLSSAMAYAAQRAAKETAENIRARAGRPVENGAQAQAPAQPREKTVSEMTREEREDLARRAMRGERIVL